MLFYKSAAICWAGEQLKVQTGLQSQHDLQFLVMYRKSWRSLPKILAVVPEYHVCNGCLFVCVSACARAYESVSRNAESSVQRQKTSTAKTELTYHSNKQGFTNPRHHVTTLTTFCTVVLNDFGSSAWTSSRSSF